MHGGMTHMGEISELSGQGMDGKALPRGEVIRHPLVRITER